MSNNVRIFFASCAAALLLGRVITGCGDGSSDASSSSGDATSSSSSSSGAGGSSSSSVTSSSSGLPCDHCKTLLTMGGSAANLCPISKAPYDAIQMCKCGMLCMKDCAVACNGAGIDALCTACIDGVCHNEYAACLADE